MRIYGYRICKAAGDGAPGEGINAAAAGGSAWRDSAGSFKV